MISVPFHCALVPRTSGRVGASFFTAAVTGGVGREDFHSDEGGKSQTPENARTADGEAARRRVVGSVSPVSTDDLVGGMLCDGRATSDVCRVAYAQKDVQTPPGCGVV